VIIHTAHLVCKPEHLSAFLERIKRHADTTLTSEPGCLRFDVHQNDEEYCLFMLYEIYEDQRALDLHRASPHFIAFRKDTADWITERTWWFWSKVDTAQP